MGRRRPRYRRVLLKLSGEALQGDGDWGIDYSVLKNISQQVREVQGVVKLVLRGKSYSLFTITQLDKVFEIFDDASAAVASFSQAASQ